MHRNILQSQTAVKKPSHQSRNDPSQHTGVASDSPTRQVFSRLSRSHTVASIGKIVPQTVRASAAQEKQHSENQRRSNESPRPGQSSTTPKNIDLRATSPPPPYSPARSRNSSIFIARDSPEWPENQYEFSRSRIPVPTGVISRIPRYSDNIPKTIRKNDLHFNDDNFDTMSMTSTSDDVFASVGRNIALAFESQESSLAEIEVSSEATPGSASMNNVENQDDIDIILRNHLLRYSPVSESDFETETTLAELERKYQTIRQNTVSVAAEAYAALASTPENILDNTCYSPSPEPHYPSPENSSQPKNGSLERKLRSTLANGDKILEANELELQKLENSEPKGAMIDMEKNNRELCARLSLSKKISNPKIATEMDGNEFEAYKELKKVNSDLFSALELLEIEAHILESERVVEFKRLEAEKLRIEAEIAKRSLTQVRTELEKAKKERNISSEKKEAFEIHSDLEKTTCSIPYSEEPAAKHRTFDPALQSGKLSAETISSSRPSGKSKSKKKKDSPGFWVSGILLP